MVYVVNGGESGGERKEREASVWKEVLFSIIASLPFFTHGLETTELASSSHSGHFMSTEDGVPWNATAYILAALVSAPVYCYVVDKCGRKVGIFLVSLAQGASCIPLFLSQDFITVIVLHVVAGISSGGLFTVLPIYVREINSLTTEGFSLSLMMVMTTVGYAMKLVMSMEYLMYVMTAVVAVQFLSMVLLIETPSYLVMRGKEEAAKQNITKLKCLDSNGENVTKELNNLKDESERARSKGNLSVIGIFRSPMYRDQTKIGVILYTTTVLCGSIVFLDSEKALLQLGISDPDKTLVLSCLFAGSLFTMLLISFVERKYLVPFGFFTMMVSMGVLAVFTQMDLTVTSLRWLPVVALGVLNFGYGVMWALPYVVMVEIYNFEIRATMIGLLFTYGQIIKLIHIHTHQYIEDYMGIYTLLYIFTSINIYGGVYSLFAIPDLKKKSNKQIEKQMKRIPLLKF
ncbi:solute carrier family 2, facilitated glucose transporter member 12-like [Ostrinia furnacalis]|uniref:solute carrier family 2, facilitated glucose transporter member 12-like n=1 Tax=Ostrinia furnacalis TaxID=93504 RepID=UPI00103B464C|nr:solute carrier family 2, facilitated glucose transporter member 12-like [Ostrinia furnacalis]